MGKYRELIVKSFTSGVILGLLMMTGFLTYQLSLSTDRHNAVQTSADGWERAYIKMYAKFMWSDSQRELNERFIIRCVDEDAGLSKRFIALKELDRSMDDFKVKQGLYYLNKHAPRFGVDLDIAITIAFVESRYDDLAVSHTSDYGLMQVNHAIWGPVFGLEEDDLLDVETNVITGLKILKLYHEKYGDRYIEKYNGRKIYAVKVGKVHEKLQQKITI